MQNKNSMFWKTSWPTWRAGQPDPTKLTWVRINLFFHGPKNFTHTDKGNKFRSNFAKSNTYDSNLQFDLKTMTPLPFLTIWTILIFENIKLHARCDSKNKNEQHDAPPKILCACQMQ